MDEKFTTLRPWTSEEFDLYEGGPRVTATYRLPTAAELMQRREAAAAALDKAPRPKPGEVAAGADPGPGMSLAEMVRLEARTFELTVPLLIQLSFGGGNVRLDGADAQKLAREDARFVPHVVAHGGFLFRYGTGNGAGRPGRDRTAPEVPGDEGHPAAGG